jgi:mRNA interferase RelE/StbE
MTHDVRFETAADRDIKKLSAEVVIKVDEAIAMLADTPRPQGSIKLKQFGDSVYRVRVGDYRILYFIDDENRLIKVLRIRRRPKAYKK